MGLICWEKNTLNIEEIACLFIGADGDFNFTY